MKYNFTNLDKFKEKPILNPFEGLIGKIATQQTKLIEAKIKELIKPYINIKITNIEELKKEFEIKGYGLIIEEYTDHKEYAIVHIASRKRDYFKELYKTDMRENKEQGKYINYSIETYFTDIVRGIKQQ